METRGDLCHREVTEAHRCRKPEENMIGRRGQEKQRPFGEKERKRERERKRQRARWKRCYPVMLLWALSSTSAFDSSTTPIIQEESNNVQAESIRSHWNTPAGNKHTNQSFTKLT